MVVGAAVFVLVLVLLQALGPLGIDTRSLAGTLLVAMGVALLAGGGVYVLIRLPLERAHESQLASLAAGAAQSQRITTDSLTGLLNRQGITASLLEAMAHAERYGNPLSVALVAIDNMAGAQQAAGRKTADRLVQSVANLFGEALRLPDRVGRYGEDEFLAVLPQAALKDAAKIAERIRANTTAIQLTIAGKKVSGTLSIGVVRFRKGEDLERLLARASEVLAKARAAGGNRVASAGTKAG
ncbi:MAG: hypothetical protein A2150_05175 [Candidatus Muproteobacteria bacterium RBG_16_64_11]|uniref:diguanylate cyclase n=1 Tax=Candidatus Muproteobacteria bacterium RBG_16_64_11 TaxID=1817758 RepID=A0A1F6TEF9_9PROT|nr:MAG: hypothetical protein A2150_05175 [Candidatus Muproteobacteria bacterium RBG_16_64_11]